MKNRTYTKTIHYKGGTITLTHTTPEYRSQCQLHSGIFCWFVTEGYANRRVFINNMDSFQPAVTLNYIRNRIKSSTIR
jgi:hypothetical protein